MSVKITVLGCRGSVPVSGPEFVRYGGATACVLFEGGGRKILLDGGTGIMRWKDRDASSADLLITHAHADHIMGLMLFGRFFDGAFRCGIYGPQDDFGADIKSQFGRLMCTPLWPVESTVFRAKLEWNDLGGFAETFHGTEFALGDVRVRVMDVNHPGGTVAYRLDCEGRSVVYAPDVELCGTDSEYFKRTAAFAEDCDMLLIDGSYDEPEYPRFIGFGHSTVQEAAKLGLACGAARTLIFHHAPTRTDAQIDHLAELAGKINPTAAAAAEDMTIEL